MCKAATQTSSELGRFSVWPLFIPTMGDGQRLEELEYILEKAYIAVDEPLKAFLTRAQ